jgi:hypothetical protein
MGWFAQTLPSTDMASRHSTRFLGPKLPRETCPLWDVAAGWKTRNTTFIDEIAMSSHMLTSRNTWLQQFEFYDQGIIHYNWLNAAGIFTTRKASSDAGNIGIGKSYSVLTLPGQNLVGLVKFGKTPRTCLYALVFPPILRTTSLNKLTCSS